MNSTKTPSSRQAQLVAEHWARRLPSFDEALALLRSKGIDAERSTAEDLHGFDMIHVGGLEATDLVAREANIKRGQRLLDIGCGLGGPARRFAYKHGAAVSGIELSEPVYQTAVGLTALVGLADQVDLTLGSVLAMPYHANTFDLVVMQHCAMQIAEKGEMFEECVRVLRADGVMVLHEFFSGAGGGPNYPLPWGSEPSMSALQTYEDTRALLEEIGFSVGSFLDQHAAAISFYSKMITRLEKAISEDSGFRGKGMDEAYNSLGIFRTMIDNFNEDRVRLAIVSCRKKTA
jgi:MPBQ/MSBQ methyltransferase